MTATPYPENVHQLKKYLNYDHFLYYAKDKKNDTISALYIVNFQLLYELDDDIVNSPINFFLICCTNFYLKRIVKKVDVFTKLLSLLL